MSNLRKENAEAAAAFVSSPAWADIKRVLMERRPPSGSVEDAPHTAAAKGFKRAAFEEALEAIEKLPFEPVEEAPASPFERPAMFQGD